VDIIHTNAGEIGTKYASGDMDFWVNGGTKSHPGCNKCVKQYGGQFPKFKVLVYFLNYLIYFQVKTPWTATFAITTWHGATMHNLYGDQPGSSRQHSVILVSPHIMP